MFRFLWRLLILAVVFGAGYIFGREHSFAEDEDWDSYDDEDDMDEGDEKSPPNDVKKGAKAE